VGVHTLSLGEVTLYPWAARSVPVVKALFFACCQNSQRILHLCTREMLPKLPTADIGDITSVLIAIQDGVGLDEAAKSFLNAAVNEVLTRLAAGKLELHNFVLTANVLTILGEYHVPFFTELHNIMSKCLVNGTASTVEPRDASDRGCGGELRMDVHGEVLSTLQRQPLETLPFPVKRMLHLCNLSLKHLSPVPHLTFPEPVGDVLRRLTPE
jgi:hypothetical protein